MWTLTIATSLLGCTTTNPETRAAIDYVTAVQPLMVENSLLSERILHMAAIVHDKDEGNEGLSAQWMTEIVPLATHLAVQAENVEAPETWRDEHTSLVVIWTDRSTAYRNMGEAMLSADRKAWKDARNLDAKVVKREENWFFDTNKRLTPFSLQLDQYP